MYIKFKETNSTAVQEYPRKQSTNNSDFYSLLKGILAPRTFICLSHSKCSKRCKKAQHSTPFPKRTWFSPPTHKQITHQSQHHPPHTKYHKSKIPHLCSHLTMKEQIIYIFPLFLHMQHQYTITILCFKRLFTIIIFPQAAIQTKMGLSQVC